MGRSMNLDWTCTQEEDSCVYKANLESVDLEFSCSLIKDKLKVYLAMSKGDALLSYVIFSQHPTDLHHNELIPKESFNPNFMSAYIFEFLVLGHEHKDISAIVDNSVDGIIEMIRMHENIRVYRSSMQIPPKTSLKSDSFLQ